MPNTEMLRANSTASFKTNLACILIFLQTLNFKVCLQKQTDKKNKLYMLKNYISFKICLIDLEQALKYDIYLVQFSSMFSPLFSEKNDKPKVVEVWPLKKTTCYSHFTRFFFKARGIWAGSRLPGKLGIRALLCTSSKLCLTATEDIIGIE